MLKDHGVEATPLREAVLEAIGEASRPLLVPEIMAAADTRHAMNKVTLYRILDLLVDKGLIKRLPTGERAVRYGMGITPNHPDHPHFVCIRCGGMECMEPDMLPVNLRGVRHISKRRITQVEVCFQGVCDQCGYGNSEGKKKRQGQKASQNPKRPAIS
jgi:Fur family ferric uptake transcriptional regulator